MAVAPQSVLSAALLARLRAAGIHLGVSVAVACILLLLISQVWYPPPLFDLAKGRDIFLLLMACDITLGPILTLIVFNVRKPRAELARDIAIIAAFQASALAYGVATLLQARPAYIVYNVGQFNVTLANEVTGGSGASGRQDDAGAPWFGPRLVGARLPADAEEKTRLLFSALGGRGDVFQMPRYFVSYADVRQEAALRARSADALARELHVEPARMQSAVRDLAKGDAKLGYLPVVVRGTLAVAAVRLPDGEFLGIARLPPT